MNGCPLPLTVKLPDYINKVELTSCNLNPVVVLTDFRKAIGSSSSSSSNNVPGKAQTQSIPFDSSSTKNSNKSFKFKIDTTINSNSSKSTSVFLSNSPQIKSGKRKRESWDPSVEYEIEEIIGYHRDKRKKMWYLVKWKNWSSDHNTFEPIDNLTGCNYELMKYFELRRPAKKEVKRKNAEIRTALEKQGFYAMLKDQKFKAEDVDKLFCKYPEPVQMFQMKEPELQSLERRMRNEYMYIVRCLIGMYSHQDPGLMLRAQNYKSLITLIQLRRNQLQNMEFVERSINTEGQTKIVLENEVDLEDFPKINYIEKIKPGVGVELSKDPLLGCECSSCTPQSRCCGVLKDSGFAYNGCGKLRTSQRIAIYECNSRCRCPPTCPNRVVQRGRQVKLCIFKTKSCGWGVKAMEKIPKGTFVCEYVGELIPDSEAVVRDIKYFGEHRSGYLFDLDFFTDARLDMYCIDATEHGNVARFINHSCDPNLIVYPVWIDGIEPNKHRLAFFARRNIQKDEEIQFDYENLEDFPVEELERNKSHGFRMLSNVRCQCNASNCREWVFGNK